MVVPEHRYVRAASLSAPPARHTPCARRRRSELARRALPCASREAAMETATPVTKATTRGSGEAGGGSGCPAQPSTFAPGRSDEGRASRGASPSAAVAMTPFGESWAAWYQSVGFECGMNAESPIRSGSGESQEWVGLGRSEGGVALMARQQSRRSPCASSRRRASRGEDEAVRAPRGPLVCVWAMRNARPPAVRWAGAPQQELPDHIVAVVDGVLHLGCVA